VTWSVCPHQVLSDPNQLWLALMGHYEDMNKSHEECLKVLHEAFADAAAGRRRIYWPARHSKSNLRRRFMTEENYITGDNSAATMIIDDPVRQDKIPKVLAVALAGMNRQALRKWKHKHRQLWDSAVRNNDQVKEVKDA